MQLVLELTEFKEIRYDLLDNNSVVDKFVKLVKSIKSKNHAAAFPSYFMWTKRNFPTAKYIDSINTSVEYFNKNNGYNHHLKPVINLNQNELNLLHYDFEHAANIYLPNTLLSSEHNKGMEKKPPKCPDIGLLAFHLNNINSNVHILEASLGMRDNIPNAYFSIFLKDMTKLTESIPLSDDEFKHFSLDVQFGDLMLGYGTTGKNLYHVFANKDIDFFNDGNAPSPQVAVTTNILGLFSEEKNHAIELKNVKEWYFKTMPEKKINFDDKKNSLGYIKLGTLNSPLNMIGMDKNEIIEYYSGLDIINYRIV